MHVIQSKNGMMMNVGVNVENYMIRVFVEKVTGGILVRMIVSVMKHLKLVSV